MNQFLLYSIFCLFFIFTKGSIVYRPFTSECKDIEEIRMNSSLLQPSDYVINIEFCIRHNDQLNEKKCCHITLDELEFCGIIEKSEYDNITNKIATLNSSAPYYNEIKIDCFSKHLNFMKITLITYLIYLI